MITVIIPSYNSETTIQACLQSLKDQNCSQGYEVILVDSSIDRTPLIVQNSFPEVTFIHLGEKTDPGTARNIGIKKARGDIFAFIDSDCIASPDWLEKIEVAHKDQVRVVGGAIINGNGVQDTVGWAGYLAEFREFIPEQPKKEMRHIPSCNVSYKKSIFEEYGLFKGQYYPQEDLFFNYQLWKRGEHILFDPTIQVAHHHRSDLGEYLRHQYKIGRITAKVLKEIPLEGSTLVRHPVLAAPAVPFLPAVKFLRTVMVFLRYQPLMIIKKPLVLGVLALGLAYWVVGFARGVYE